MNTNRIYSEKFSKVISSKSLDLCSDSCPCVLFEVVLSKVTLFYPKCFLVVRFDLSTQIIPRGKSFNVLVFLLVKPVIAVARYYSLFKMLLSIKAFIEPLNSKKFYGFGFCVAPHY